MKTGKFARDVAEYTIPEVNALLFHGDTMYDEAEDMEREFAWAQEQAKPRVDVTKPIRTGDKLADEWERQIAAGELPDWMRE